MSNSLFKTAIASATTLLISSFFLLANPANANLFVCPLYLKTESEQGQSKGILRRLLSKNLLTQKPPYK